MRSTIERHTKLTELLNNTDGILEVYADKDFSTESDSVDFRLLLLHPIDVAIFYSRLNKLYDGNANVHVTLNPFDYILTDQRIIWRKGTWYLH